MSAPSQTTNPLSGAWQWLCSLRRRHDLLHTYAIAVAFLILVALVTIGNHAFLSPGNLANMLGQWAPAGIMAVAMTYVIIARGFDLSVSSGFSLCAIAAAATAAAGNSTLFAFAASIATGVAIGLFNALLVCGLSINPFIATIGSGFIFLGLDIVATPNASISVEEAGFDTLGSGSWYGIPFKGMILIAFLLIGGLVLAKSRYGQYLYAIGGNPEASRLSGLRVRMLSGSTYVLSGFSMGVAGMLAASQLSSAQAQMEPTIVFDVFAIVVLGGTSLTGGYGAIWRTAVGLAIIATISNGFNLLDINPFYQNIVKGSVIILAVAFEGWARRFAAARLATELAADAQQMERNSDAEKKEPDTSDNVPEPTLMLPLRRVTS
jgi:ribose transport system permease protein